VGGLEMVLSISQITPIVARLGEDTLVNVIGTDFTGNPTVEIQSNPTVDGLSLNVVDSTKITCVIPGTMNVGTYDVILNIGAASTTLFNGIVVAQPFPEFPFINETFDNIMSRMTQRLPDDYDKRQGSTFWDILAPMGIELSKMYLSINEAAQLGLITESTGAFLDLKAIEYGITRKAVTKATVTLTFTSSGNATVAIGTRISTVVPAGQTPIEFETDSPAVTRTGAGTLSVPATAVLAGTTGNVAASTITNLVSANDNVTAVTNAAASASGTNAESDDDLRARALRRIREPSHGGNIGDYILWAQEASPLVDKVGVAPLAGGAGTVSVYILRADNTLAESALVTTVQDYIDPAVGTTGKAPIGAAVTVASAQLTTVAVAVTIAALPGFTAGDVRADVDTAIQAFINGLPIGDNVGYHALSSAIQAVNGVNTMSSYTVATASVDLVIAATHQAVPGTITIS